MRLVSRPVRIAVDLQQQHADYHQIRAAAVRAEEMGVDVLFNWDHFFPLSGDPDGKHFECWTMLASFAEVTERVEIGPLVSANSYRNPELLADMARTVDHISGGRLILGIGAGWFERDYEEYGYEFGTAGTRLDRAAGRAAPDREPLGAAESSSNAGDPDPDRWRGERRTLRYTARHADIWHGFGRPDVIRHKNQVLNDWCAREGRDPDEIERSCGANPAKPDSGDGYVEAGATLLTLSFDGRDAYDLAPLGDWIAWRDERNGA